MKKILSFILAFIYLTATIGVTVTTHYCMGKKYGTDLSQKDNCSRCGMKVNHGCCKDEAATFRIQDSHFAAAGHPSINGQSTAAILVHIQDGALALLSTSGPFPGILSPPGKSGRSRCIQHCTFQI